MERMRAARERIAHHDDPQRFRDLGVDVRFGDARFVSTGVVEVDGTKLSAPRIVVATGAVPSVPPVPGLEEAGYLTHVTAFDADELPRRMIILGGGPIGLEFAQVYRRLGAEVTVVELLPNIFPREEAEAAEAMFAVLAAEGIAVRTGLKAVSAARRAGSKVVDVVNQSGATSSIEADEIFVATGRRANTEGLGLAGIGVELDRGAVKVGPSLRSSISGIWAAGDVAGGLQFTHVADYQAKLVLRNSVFPFTSKADYSKVPWVTYTDPEVARVGLTEQEARAVHGEAVRAYRYQFDDLDRAIVDGETKGFVKVVTGKKARILGATLVGSGAGNLIVPIVIAMNKGISLPKLSQFVYPYPTMAEGVKRAADTYYREKFAGRSGEWLRKVVRWLA